MNKTAKIALPVILSTSRNNHTDTVNNLLIYYGKSRLMVRYPDVNLRGYRKEQEANDRIHHQVKIKEKSVVLVKDGIFSPGHRGHALSLRPHNSAIVDPVFYGYLNQKHAGN